MADFNTINNLKFEPATVEVDFPVEEYEVSSRKTLRELFGRHIPADIAANVVIGKNLNTEDLISVPPHLHDCRIYRKINRPKPEHYHNSEAFEKIIKSFKFTTTFEGDDNEKAKT